MAKKDKGSKSKRTGPKNKGEAKKLSAKIYSGLSAERLAKKSGGNRLIINKKNPTKTVQLLDEIEEMKEYDMHSFREGRGWVYVPCAGEECPLCDDEDDEVSSIAYRAAANVWSFDDNAVLVLEGGKEIFGKIGRRIEKAKQKKKDIRKTTLEISRIEGDRVSYDVDSGDEDPIDFKPLLKKRHDLDAFVNDQIARYYKDDNSGPKKASKKSALDDDDEDEYEEDEASYTKSDLKAMSPKQLKRAAKDAGVKYDAEKPNLTIKRILASQED